MVKLVNPLDSDEIGKSIMQFINGDTFQPELSNYILSNYSKNSIGLKLSESYKSIFFK